MFSSFKDVVFYLIYLDGDSNEEDEGLDEIEAESREIISSNLPSDLEHIPYKFQKYSSEESIQRSKEFYELMDKRRTVRFFSSEPVSEEIIHNIIWTAGKC